MTRDELKNKLTPILCDMSLTKEERSAKVGPIFIELLPESIRKEPKSTRIVEIMGEIWNSVIAEIVEENHLGADGKGIKQSAS